MKTQVRSIPANLTRADLPASITVNGDAWQKYRKADAKAKAAEKEAKALKVELGFPDTETLVKLLNPTPSQSRDAVILDGNGSPVGKVTVFHRDAFQMPACFVSRIS